MITNVAAQWILSAIFVATAAYAVCWIVKSGTLRARVSYLTHVLMSAAMFTMIWPWGVSVLLAPQVVIFSLATLWFVYLLVSRRSSGHSGELPDGHHDGKRTLAYHAGMMGAMVVMAAGMTGMTSGSGAPATTGMASMPGMDMSAGGSAGMVVPLWVGLASLALAIAFGVATLYYIGSCLAAATATEEARRPRVFRTANASWNALMAAGMAALFIPMVSFG